MLNTFFAFLCEVLVLLVKKSPSNMEYYQEIKWHEHAEHITNTQRNIYLTSGKF